MSVPAFPSPLSCGEEIIISEKCQISVEAPERLEWSGMLPKQEVFLLSGDRWSYEIGAYDDEKDVGLQLVIVYEPVLPHQMPDANNQENDMLPIRIVSNTLDLRISN